MSADLDKDIRFTLDQGSRAVLWFAIVPEQLLSRLMLRSPKGLQGSPSKRGNPRGL